MDWKLIMLLLAGAGFLYNLILHLVQYRSANNPTPANVADVYDAETYRRWKAYCAAKSRLHIFSGIASFLLLLCLLLTNAHAAFAAWFPSNIFMQLTAVVVLQTVADALLGVVFDYVETMVIEEKYGFNRSTLKTFVADQIRGLLLNLLLAFALMSALAGLHLWLGDWVVLLFVVVLFGFTLAVSFLYPIFSRIGNKFTPLEDGQLKDRLMELLTKHGYQVKAIEVMDASRRTTKLNAYFTGFGKLKTIVLYDNLVNAMTTDEICAVFAHELGHGLHKDVLKQQLLNLLNLLLIALAAWVVIRQPDMHLAFGFDAVNYGFAYLLLSFLLGLVQPLTGILTAAYSRKAEYRADRQAVAEGYGAALGEALKKLSRENFSHLAPSKLLVVLEYSHPPLSQRLEALDEALKQ